MTPERQSEIWEEVWNKNLNPGYLPIEETPAEQKDQKAGQKVETFYSPSQPVPAEAVRSNVPVYKPTDVTEMLGTLANGGELNAGEAFGSSGRHDTR